MKRYFNKEKTRVMNQRAYDYLFCEYYCEEDRRTNLDKNYQASIMLEEVTKSDEKMLRMVTSLKNNPLPITFNDDTNYYNYCKDGLSLNFRFISSESKDINEKNILESDDRYGRCNKVIPE